MAPRATWKGHLKLSLVSCPVRLYNAVTSGERVAFNLLHKDTHNRIQMKPHDPELGAVERGDLVKGYQYEKDQYVVFADEDFEKIQVETSQAIVIEKFVDAAEVDQLYLDSPYFLAPDGAIAEETFRVVQQAMVKKKKVALARLVMSGRERLIALAPRDRGLLVTTLRHAGEVRDHAPVFDEIGDGRADKDMLQMATQLIEQKSGTFDPSEFQDRYQEAVLAMVKAKIQGQAPVIAKAPERGKVINLMDALRQSLDQSSKPPAKSRSRKDTAARTPAEPVAAAKGGRKRQAKAS
jgi:DNA end-binding protein Ku